MRHSSQLAAATTTTAALLRHLRRGGFADRTSHSWQTTTTVEGASRGYPSVGGGARCHHVFSLVRRPRLERTCFAEERSAFHAGAVRLASSSTERPQPSPPAAAAARDTTTAATARTQAEGQDKKKKRTKKVVKRRKTKPSAPKGEEPFAATEAPTPPETIVRAHLQQQQQQHQHQHGHEQELLSSSEAKGWNYEEVDPATGKTALDRLYDAQLARIHTILRQPLPPLPQDGSVDPDFFVGFAHYNYRLRDEYRALIARELHVPVAAVRLSVAWSGRFDVQHFRHVQKVCGVDLDRAAVAAAAATTTTTGKDKDPLPEDLQRRVDALVKTINAKENEALLTAQFLQASAALPEVEFALSKREHRLYGRLQAWLSDHVLRQHVAVILYGGNTVYNRWKTEKQQQQQNEKERKDQGSAAAAAPWRRWVQRDLQDEARQQQYIESKWLRLFYGREMVPYCVPLRAVAALLARAVVAGEVPEVTTTITTTTTTTTTAAAADQKTDKRAQEADDSSLLPASVRVYVRELGKATEAFVSAAPGGLAGAEAEINLHQSTDDTSTITDGNRKRAPAAFPSVFAHLEAEAGGEDKEGIENAEAEAVSEAAVEWLYIVRQALFVNANYEANDSNSVNATTTTTTTASVEGSDDEDGRHTAAAPSSHVWVGPGQLPALFLHGGYAGGPREMRYLQLNKKAMDAVLLRPNDISFKRAFENRIKNSHTRLRVFEEAETPYKME